MIKIEELTLILTQAGVTDSKVKKAIIQEAEKLEAEKKSEAADNKGVKQKNKLTIIVRGDDAMEKALAAGWVIKTPLDQDDNEVINRITIGAARHNSAQKRQKNIIKSFSDFFLLAKREFTKEYECSIQAMCKEPVRVIVLKDENIDFGK